MTLCTMGLDSGLLWGGQWREESGLVGVFQTIQTTFPLCWVSRAWTDGVFVEGLVIPAVINLCFELRNDVEAERHMFAFVCHMSDVSTLTVHWPFYGY